MEGQQSSRRVSERGEGNWGNLVMLFGTALLALCAWNAGPVFMKNFEFQDKVTEISRSYPPGDRGNEQAKKALEIAIDEVGLSEFLTVDDCSVKSQGGIGGTRTVTCTYKREYKLLPGMIRTHTFSPSATSPTL
jgi:hypothetical protein